jgi:chromosome partitioning protein
MSTKIITIANQKGGVGKTTCTVNLAAIGKNVLAIDLDPQGNLSTALGLPQEKGAYYLLTMGQQSELELAFLKQVVRPTGRPNFWLIPGDRDTLAAQTDLSIRERPISYLRQTLEVFTGNGLEYILIDTSPSLGGLQERALWAADWVIIPTALEYLSSQGVSHLLDTLQLLQQKRDWSGGLLGVLPTFFDDTTRQSQVTLSQLKQVLNGRLLPVIHRATIQREATAAGHTIFEKAPGCRTAREYQMIIEAVLRATRRKEK